MRTTTITVTIEARADDSESRIREAIMADIDQLFKHRHARSTEDGKSVHIMNVEPHEIVARQIGLWK